MPVRQERKFLKGRVLFSLMCLYGIVLSASCRQTYDSSAKFTPAQLREDFRVFRLSLEEGQPGLNRHTGKDELERIFSGAEKSLDHPLDVLEFYRVLSPPISAIRCGHTNVELPEFVKEQLSTRFTSFPALIKIIDGRIFVWRDLGAQGSALAGKEVLAINKVPAAEIVSNMLAETGGDGDIQTSRIKRIEGWNFVEKLTPLTGLHAPFELTVLDPAAGRSEQVRLGGIDAPTLRRNWAAWFPQDQRPPHSGELEFIDGENIARMTVREFGGFVDDEHRRGLEGFFPDAFQQMAANKTKVLILDLRDNDGGDDRLGTLLLSYLFDKPFEHYRDIVARDDNFTFGEGIFGTTRIRLSYKTERRGDGLHHVIDYPNLGVLQPSGPTFSGKIFVLMNGGSFSTTAEVITQLHSHRRAEFIGEESGGAYDGNNSGTIARVTLPNTKLTLLVPLMSYYLAVGGDEDKRRGVKPDYPVGYSIGDYLTNSDKNMTLALEKARLWCAAGVPVK